MDGVSLWPWISGDADSAGLGFAIAEYHGEGVQAPCFMVRQDSWKYIRTMGEPPQLYDLDTDPGEWDNRSGATACAGVESRLATLLDTRFDPAAIDRAVRDSQRRRLYMREAMQQEPRTRWNFSPQFDVHNRYVR